MQARHVGIENYVSNGVQFNLPAVYASSGRHSNSGAVKIDENANHAPQYQVAVQGGWRSSKPEMSFQRNRATLLRIRECSANELHEPSNKFRYHANRLLSVRTAGVYEACWSATRGCLATALLLVAHRLFNCGKTPSVL